MKQEPVAFKRALSSTSHGVISLDSPAKKKIKSETYAAVKQELTSSPPRMPALHGLVDLVSDDDEPPRAAVPNPESIVEAIFVYF